MTSYHGGRPRVIAHEHGTRSKYVTDKCRCDACRAANTAYNVERYRAMPRHEQRLVRQYTAEYDQQLVDALLFGTTTCSVCGAELPKRGGYFKDEDRGVCRACRNEQSRERYAADSELREKQRARNRVRKAAEYAARKGEG